MSQQIIPFEYEGKNIRVITDDAGEPWWVATDVCRVLELDQVSRAISRLDEDEKTTLTISTGLIKQGLSNNAPGTSLNIINEPGLYSLILTSRKPEARAFKRWVTHEVLPALRKTGTYTMKNPRAKKPLAGRKPAPADMGLPEGLTMRQVITDIKTWVSFLRMIGLDKNQALLSAIEHESLKIGADLKRLLPGSLLVSPDQATVFLRPTDIAERLGLQFKTGGSNGHLANKLLEDAGFQIRAVHGDGDWQPTEKGKIHAHWRDIPKAHVTAGRPIRQLFWKESIVDLLQAKAQEKQSKLL